MKYHTNITNLCDICHFLLIIMSCFTSNFDIDNKAATLKD